MSTFAQTTLTEAVSFHVKTIYGEPIWLFPLLDDENKIVVIDFFSTTCGPCQDYADDFQAAYENFGSNEGNVYFVGINWGNDNQGVAEFDSIYGLTFPTASGSQGGGNIVYSDYDIQSYPTVIVITPDHNIVEQYIWYPTEENITNAVIAAGGIYVSTNDIVDEKSLIYSYPNPITNTGNITFNINSPSKVTLSIYNLMGKKVTTSSSVFASSGNVSIGFSADNLKNGYYFAKVDTDKGNIGIVKFIVSK